MKRSTLLIQSHFSDWLIEDALREAETYLSPEQVAILQAEVTEKAHLADKKKLLSTLKKHLSSSTLDGLLEELAEMKDDLTWSKSKRGQYVSELQDWIASFSDELRTIKKFETLMVGGHDSLEVVYIVGNVDSEKTLDEFITYLSEKNPPRKFKTKVHITGN